MMSFAASSEKLACAPGFNLPAHRFEVALHAVDADREDVHEAQAFCVLGEHGRERARDNVAKPGIQVAWLGASRREG
jgi:hypothetical protein